ncbi:glycosyltransferase family 2 protein [Actinoalloteichus spitiensis]|uniref:glycosyltransferase family 2 protein n=1 Tax=Actinoalloteichus spitiensis TaxID=252394 RepID=UPI00036B1EA8|nr:glycosyltransferase family 2 protein [Actinoalloteichus spitiensis]
MDADPGATPVRSTVVIVTWRARDHLEPCLDALAEQTRPHRLLVVDNASDDGTAELLRGHPTAPEVLRLSTNSGYAGGMAAALRRVRTEFMVWLNDDAVPERDWLAALEDAADSDPTAGAVGSLLRAEDGTVQSAGVTLTADGHGRDLGAAAGAAAPTGPTEVFSFCGGAALVRTEALRALGGVPGSYFCYYEDTDAAWRLRLGGWRVRLAPAARVRHAHGASSDPGSPRFHRWNERNRLVTLVRCAPLPVALRELLRFAAITAALPVRRRLGRPAPEAANFRVGLRLGVLGETLARMPAALRFRRELGRRVVVDRAAVWRTWAGRDDR